MLPACANAAGEWLTVLGNPSEAAVTTIEVNPVTIAISGDQRTMQVRINRSVQRTTPDGVTFRSFNSSVLFDCVQKTARFVSVDFYAQPLWQGEIFKSVTYSALDARNMEFREVEPSPRDRIIRAACRSGFPAN